jgi:hypothetical protein
MVPFGKGARAQGQIKRRSNPRLEPTLPKFISATKERESWRRRKRPRRRASPEHTGVRLVLGQRRYGLLRFRGVTDPAKRLNSVRPLLFWKQRFGPIRRSATSCHPQKHKRRPARSAHASLAPRRRCLRSPSARVHRHRALRPRCLR